jgi:hypothetical protein
MRTWVAGTGTADRVWPETLMLSHEADLADADRAAQRVVLANPLTFGGPHPDEDLAGLRLLSEATARLVDLEWTLGGEPPWPVRTLVHLTPPSGGTDPAARGYADRWRQAHRFGQCAYRRGPGFVRIRDTRPAGPVRRIMVNTPWDNEFDKLAAAESFVDDHSGQLLDELVEADLAVRLGDRHHLLLVRLNRWPTPHPDRR